MRMFEQTAGWLADHPDPSRFDVAFDMIRMVPAGSEAAVVELDGDPDLISWVSGRSLEVDGDRVYLLMAELSRETVIVVREVSGP